MIKKDGFDFCFDENACANCGGNCCTGQSGYIWITPSELENLADFLKLDRSIFIKDYLQKVGYKFSIKEKFDDNLGHCCIFFDTQKKCCSVYQARPIQCRTFPFWDYFKDKIEEVKKECPGIK